MKRIFILFSVFLICLALATPSFARDGRGGPKDRVWRGMTTTPTVNDDASRGKRQGDEWHYGGRIWILTAETIGVAVWEEQVSKNALVLANETLGGVSTFVITGNLDMTTLASATAALLTAGRIIEIKATTSPIVKLSAMSVLSSVTNQMIFVDVTTAGNDSGVTLWSPTNKIGSGVGSTWTSGDTVFINSGNSGFTLALKAINAGSAVTPMWKVWSFNGNTLRRP